MTRAQKPLGDAWPVNEAAAHYGLAVSDTAREALAAWLDLLVTWNARMDLTAARSPDELVDLMLGDAIVLAQRVPEGARVVDVGTGAGAPGLPLALLRPDLAVTLVEPLVKRVSFLRTVVGTVGLEIAIVRGKGEDCAARGETWDVAMARATLPPPAWLALGARLAPAGGSVWVLLAKEPAPDLAGATREEIAEYTWPRGGAARTAVRYRTG